MNATAQSNTDADKLFKAIAHPARRHILTLLAGSDQTVKQLTSSFAMSQPAVSQHLRELREAKLVTSQRVGSEQRYRLHGAPLETVYEWCIGYRKFFDPAGHAWVFTSTSTKTLPARRGKKDGH